MFDGWSSLFGQRYESLNFRGADKKAKSRRIIAFSACLVLALLFVLFHLYGGQTTGTQPVEELGEIESPPPSPVVEPALIPTPAPTPDDDAKEEEEPEEKPDSEKPEEKPEEATAHIVEAIMNTTDTSVERLSCPQPGMRYDHLKISNSDVAAMYSGMPTINYFFALDLFNCAHVLPTLLGAVVEAIRFLGAENCALSIVEGRSTDSTYEILADLREKLGIRYYLNTSDIDPHDGKHDRIESLATLRNQALQPLIDERHLYTSDAVVIFLNDITLCSVDVLELLHQQYVQSASLTCAMDWNDKDNGILFYDSWVARGITGDTFFEIPQNSAWWFASNLFWNDPQSKRKLEAREPFQVYACWNGGVVFRAKFIVEDDMAFRRSAPGECVMGEPTLFCKDLWRRGLGKIQVVPTVNVAYDVRQGRMTKEARGSVDQEQEDVLIEWQIEPPPMVKCAQSWGHPTWVSPV